MFKKISVLVLLFMSIAPNLHAEGILLGRWEDKSENISLVEEGDKYHRFIFYTQKTGEEGREYKEYLKQDGKYVPITKISIQSMGVIIRVEDNPELYYMVNKKGNLEIYNKNGLEKQIKKVKE